MPTRLFDSPAGSRFIALRSELLAACDGRHCEAILLNELEYYSRDDGAGQLIAEISLPELEHHLMGLYAQTKIRDALQWLAQRSFIDYWGKPGRTGRYRVLVENVNAAIHPDPLRNDRVPPQKYGGTPSETRGSLNKEVEDSKDVDNPPPTPPTAQEAPQRIDNWLRQEASARGLKFRVQGRAREHLIEADSEELRAAAYDVIEANNGGQDITGAVLRLAGYRVQQIGRPRPREPVVRMNGHPRNDAAPLGVFGVRLIDCLCAVGYERRDADRSVRAMPAWKLAAVEATALDDKSFEQDARMELCTVFEAGASVDAGLEKLYRQFGQVAVKKRKPKSYLEERLGL